MKRTIRFPRGVNASDYGYGPAHRWLAFFFFQRGKKHKKNHV